MLPLVHTVPRPSLPPGGLSPAGLLATWVAETAGGRDDLKPRLLRLSDGHLVPLDVARWSGPVDRADESLLSRATGAVLDVGCGPGRLTAALHRRGVDVLGLELADELPVLAREAGAPLVVGDVFGEVPRAGAWDSVLLADGNVGIGGDPVALLQRVREILDPRGRVVAEIAEPGIPLSTVWASLQCGETQSRPFRWSVVGVDDIATVANDAGFESTVCHEHEGRWWAVLQEAA